MTEHESKGDDEPSPPVPVEAVGQVARTDCNSIPDGLFDEEHVTEIGDMTVVEAGVVCPRCDSDIFYHPESIIPHNTVQCFNCQRTAYGYAWWEDQRLTDFKHVATDE